MQEANHRGVYATTEEIRHRDDWLQANFKTGAVPFSFLYDGRRSGEVLEKWPRSAQASELAGGRIQQTIVWQDSISGLEVRCVAISYADFPIIEWTVFFKNTGTTPTPLLENIQGLDTRFERGNEGEFILHGNRGDWCVPESFEPYQYILGPTDIRRFAPVGGRPTDGPDGWPYFNLQKPDGGVILAIGWPGQWACSFIRDDKNGLQVVAGQELTHLVLRSNEEIRTPLTAVLFWQGADTVRAQNLWRRWMSAHNVPKSGGKQQPPRHCFCSGGFFPGLKCSEASEKMFIDTLDREGIRFDYWWMDAGWYPCHEWWDGVGTWDPDLERFPGGIKAISDYVHGLGTKLILWFEPERVASGTWIAVNHPEWLLGERLLNLGDPTARQWLTNHVDTFITEQGVDFYRQDFNMEPLDFWRANDTWDRQGMTENFHVQGYLAYWDELRRRHPDLLIDACASGGRRIDLETLRRAVPDTPSDYIAFDGDPRYASGNQGHTFGLSSWLPYYGQGVYPSFAPGTAYYVRSHMSPSFTICVDIRQPGIDWDLYRRIVNQWRQVADFMLGDYYPLTPYALQADRWMAWQFNRPEQGDGMIQAFRREQNDNPEQIFFLQGLEVTAQYELVDLDIPDTRIVSGTELMEQGLRVEIEDKPGAKVIIIRKIQVQA